MGGESIKKEKSEDVVIWVRVPKGTTVCDIEEGHWRPRSDERVCCIVSSTCICARAFGEDGGIVVQGPKRFNFSELMNKAGFKPQPKCFGGDCCIV